MFQILLYGLFYRTFKTTYHKTMNLLSPRRSFEKDNIGRYRLINKDAINPLYKNNPQHIDTLETYS